MSAKVEQSDSQMDYATQSYVHLGKNTMQTKADASQFVGEITYGMMDHRPAFHPAQEDTPTISPINNAYPSAQPIRDGMVKPVCATRTANPNVHMALTTTHRLNDAKPGVQTIRYGTDSLAPAQVPIS